MEGTCRGQGVQCPAQSRSNEMELLRATSSQILNVPEDRASTNSGQPVAVFNCPHGKKQTKNSTHFS